MEALKASIFLRRLERLISIVVLFRVLRWFARLGPRAALKQILGKFLAFARNSVPGVEDLVKKEVAKELRKIELKFHGSDGDVDAVFHLPDQGMSVAEVKELALKRKVIDEETAKKKFGKSWGGIYHDSWGDGPGGMLDSKTPTSGQETLSNSKTHALCDLQLSLYQSFSQTNALYPAVFTSVRKFQGEVIAMVLSILGGRNGNNGTPVDVAREEDVKPRKEVMTEDSKQSKTSTNLPVGLLTSGGTESIFIAVLTFRERAKKTTSSEGPWEIVACSTAHPALDKACHYLGVKLIKIQPDEKSLKMTAVAAEKVIAKGRTIALFASAPTFPHGVIDEIGPLAALARKQNLLLHVDNCLGGFYLSFLEIDLCWNFDLPGVSTISIDIHKYGFAEKGASVIAFRDAELRREAYFPILDGPTLYVTPTLQGARGGASIASAWATLLYMGRDGYNDSVRRLDSTFRAFKQVVRDTDGLRLLTEISNANALAVIPIVADKDTLNIYAVANLLEKRGWGLFTARDPACCSICIGEQHERLVHEWKVDLKSAVEEVRANPKMEVTGDAAVYGAANSLLPQEVLDSVVRGYVDIMLDVK